MMRCSLPNTRWASALRRLMLPLGLLALGACPVRAVAQPLPGDDPVPVAGLDVETQFPAGKLLFEQQCMACHALNREGIGPRLGGVTELFSREDLTRRIRNSSGWIQTGDERITTLRNQYKMVMPPFEHLSDEVIGDILDFMDEQSKRERIAPLVVDSSQRYFFGDRVVDPIIRTGLAVELEEYVRIPLPEHRTPTKGIATLRGLPAGDGSLLVSDQMGIIHRVDQDRSPTVFLDIREIFEDFITHPGIGTGLGSFDLHPDFLATGLFYTTHAEPRKDKPGINDDFYRIAIPEACHWVLTEWRATDPRAAAFSGTRREVLRVTTPTTAHTFQDLGFSPVRDPSDPDYGMLYLGIGDGGSINLKKPELCHTNRSLLGTIIRIDPSGRTSPSGQYGIPPDNPFAGSPDPAVRQEIWAYGFRNPHRFCWDPRHGYRMIATDIGEKNVEEVNIIEKGRDYGWPVIEGGFGIDIHSDPKVVFEVSAAVLARYQLPYGQYDHHDGHAISGGFVYRGSIGALNGKYIFGDIVSGKLFYMNMDEALSDAAIYALRVFSEGQETTIRELCGRQRTNLRIGYNEFTHEMFVMTKDDGVVRKIVGAHFTEAPAPGSW